MNDQRRSPNRVGAHTADAALGPASGKPSPRRPPQPDEVYCEIDGLAVELDRAELSSAGMFVETAQPAAEDSEVEVFVRIGELRIATLGHVIKAVSCGQATESGKRPGYALLFTNLSDAERKQLGRAIAALPAPPPTAAASPRVLPPRRSAQAATVPLKRPKPTRADAEELSVVARLTGELGELAAKTPWSVLGVSQGADASELKSAFFAASKRYHPHLFARYAHPEIKRLSTELFIAHKRAYTTLLKSAKSGRMSRP